MIQTLTFKTKRKKITMFIDDVYWQDNLSRNRGKFPGTKNIIMNRIKLNNSDFPSRLCNKNDGNKRERERKNICDFAFCFLLLSQFMRIYMICHITM